MNIAFISSALSSEKPEGTESFDFFAGLLSGIVRSAHDSGHRVSVFVPKKEGTSSDQADLLADVLREPGAFDAFVIAPFEVEPVKKLILDLLGRDSAQPPCDGEGKAPTKPIVFVDKVVNLSEVQEKINPRYVVQNVTCGNEQGGYKAANILYRTFKRSGLPKEGDRLRFLIIRGLEGDEDRVKGFRNYIKENLATCSVDEAKSPDLLNFTRGGAREWMEEQLILLRNGQMSKFGSLDDRTPMGVFACNDEMALGIRGIIADEYRKVRESLSLATNTSTEIDFGEAEKMLKELYFFQNIRIVGFDGIASAVELIGVSDGGKDTRFRQDRWLVGTIRAEAEAQSKKAIKWVDILRKNPERAILGGDVVETRVVQ